MSRLAWTPSLAFAACLLAACPSEPEPKRAPPKPEQFEDLGLIFAGRSARTAAVEAQLRPVLDKAIGSGAYEIECRGDLCKLDATTADRDWYQRIQRDPEVRRALADILFRGHETYVRAKAK
ncbi:MAG TPA: hypothetical protein VIV11_40895 [Kofleriaceae bacterium]